MSEAPEGASVELVVAMNRLVDRMDRMEQGRTPASHAEVSVSAGGVGVWIATMSAVVCFLMTMVLLVLYVDQSRKIDDLGDYLSAIYMQAPHLKPEDGEK